MFVWLGTCSDDRADLYVLASQAGQSSSESLSADAKDNFMKCLPNSIMVLLTLHLYQYWLFWFFLNSFWNLVIYPVMLSINCFQQFKTSTRWKSENRRSSSTAKQLNSSPCDQITPLPSWSVSQCRASLFIAAELLKGTARIEKPCRCNDVQVRAERGRGDPRLQAGAPEAWGVEVFLSLQDFQV